MLQTFLILLFLMTPAWAASLNAPAPAFVLKNSQQQSRSLADYHGHVVLINFWASWCAPCQEELPELNRLAAAYAGRARVVAINIDTDHQAAKDALARLGLSSSHLEILWDPKSKVVSKFNIDTMPASYILDRHGVIRSIHSGYHPTTDPAAWRQEFDAQLAAK